MSPLAVPVWMILAVGLYAGANHLYVFAQARQRRVDLAFGVHCMVAGIFMACSALLVDASAPGQARAASHIQDSWGLLVAASFLVFVHEYTQKGDPRWVRALAVLVAVACVALGLSPASVLMEPTDQRRELTLFGTELFWYEPRPRPALYAVYCAVAAAFIYAFVLVVRHLRTGDRRARPLFFAMSFIAVGIASDFCVEAGIYTIPYLLPYTYLALVVVMAFFLSRDVLRTSQVEEALHESEERFSLAVAGANDGIFDWDLASDQVFFSKRVTELMDLPVVDGSSPFEAILRRLPEDEQRRVREAIARNVEHGGRLDLQFTMSVRGEPRWLHVRGDAVRDARGRATRIAGAISDVTERHRLEERLRQSQKMESIGLLAGGVAHDFNNMLVGIIGHAELLLRDDSLPGEAHGALRSILESGSRAADLTKKLLTFARRGPEVVAHVDLHVVLTHVLGLLERTVDPRIALQSAFEAEHATVRADAAQLQSAVLNLGINGRDAMPDGGTLTLSTRNLELKPEERAALGLPERVRIVELAVTDTGVGIPDELRERIFEPFFTTKPVGAGTGLGLASVYATVRDLNGAIELRTAVGEGTRFRILLPVAEPVPVVAPTQDMPIPELTGRALVIDDEPTVRHALARALRVIGFEVMDGPDGESGVELLALATDDVDVILMDVRMPGMSASETLAALRRIAPTTPILVMSGFSGDEDVEALLAQGATAFLAKPFQLQELQDALIAAFQSSASGSA